MITEDQLEQQCLGWFQDSGWSVAFGPDLAHDGPTPERTNYRDVVLTERLMQALARLNPQIPAGALEEVALKVLKLDHPVPEQRNRDFHRLLLAGVPVTWRQGDEVKHDQARLVDFTKVDANEFLVVNQFAIKGPQKTRRPDIVVFLNGLPLALIELKNPADEHADIWKAYQQLQTYKEEIPDLFTFNEALVVSDGFTARVGSLVVDYIGIANDLKAALKTYTDANGRGQPNRKLEEALPKLRSNLDACRGLFHGFDYSRYATQATSLLVPAANHVLGLDDGKKRFLDLVAAITRAFALCGTLDEAAELRQEIAFFSAVKASIVKYTTVDRKLSEAEKHSALRRILDNAVVSEGVADIFALAGINKPNIGLLSAAFLEDVRNMPTKNLAVELLEKLLRDEIKAHTRTNVVLQKKFGDRLLDALRKYHNRAIETAQVIEELLHMARDFKDAIGRNEALGLSPDEVAFYDALAERPEVLQTMGDEQLKKLAAELTEQLRQSTSVDWQVRESVRAKMRLLIKRLLRKYRYPPEGQEEAIGLVLKQAEALADEWSK